MVEGAGNPQPKDIAVADAHPKKNANSRLNGDYAAPPGIRQASTDR
jgi:hypothetical protein